MLRRFTSIGQKRPKIWLLAWLTWFVTLWFLSSGTPNSDNVPNIPHLDKIAHFGFFFGGGGLLCAWIRHQFKNIKVLLSIGITTLVGSLVGIIDEYHQTFTPGRTGNDLGDWAADSLGSLAGAIVMILVLKHTCPHSSRTPPTLQ